MCAVGRGGGGSGCSDVVLASGVVTFEESQQYTNI
jgi:hypothetical protein